jgi:AhpD family alkylhydroperoxidase
MSLALIAKQQPTAVNALYRLKHEVFKDGALSEKTKALMAVSISCVLKCDTCVEVHASRAKELGASADELREAMLVAMYLTGPSSVVWSPIVDDVLGGTPEKKE